VNDDRLLVEAARSVITEAQVRADSLAAADTGLGQVEQAEARRIKSILISFIPTLEPGKPVERSVM
jgi:hypothetical protein